MGKVLSIAVIVVAAGSLLFAYGANSKAISSAHGGLLRAVQELDSRLVPVEKACRADEVTIEYLRGPRGEYTVKEQGESENDCKKKVVNRVYDLAQAECQLYRKVKNGEEQCSAHRGNLNPTEDIGFENRTTCYLKPDIKYVCN